MKHRRTVILNVYRELHLGHTPQMNRLEWFNVIFFDYSFNYTRSGEKTLTVSSVYIQHTEVS